MNKADVMDFLQKISRPRLSDAEARAIAERLRRCRATQQRPKHRDTVETAGNGIANHARGNKCEA